jgi:hypothetical protein
MVERVFAENPKDEIWRRLRFWSYRKNVERKLAAKHSSITAELAAQLSKEIAVLVVQGQEYFRAAEAVQLYTRPLHVYYGTVALLVALYMYETGKQHHIRCHGLNLQAARGDLMNWEIRPQKTIAGCAQAISPVISAGLDISRCGCWTVKECFGSIPDLVHELTRNPNPAIQLHVVPLTTANTEDGLCYLVEQVGCLPLEPDWFDHVWRRKEFFLPAAFTQDGSATFRPKLAIIEDEDVLPRGTDGRLYLPLLHMKGTDRLYHSVLLSYFIGLYSLGMISRYHPVDWGRLVDEDDSGELEMFRLFIGSATRQVPNLVLNRLSGCIQLFSAEMAKSADLRESLSREEIRKWIRNALSKEGGHPK